MKHTLTTIALLLLSLNLFSQEVREDDWEVASCLATNEFVGLDIDFSEADILGVSFDEYVAVNPSWESYYQLMKKSFSQEFNENADRGKYPHRIKEPHSCQMIIKINSVQKRGTRIIGTIILLNKEGNEVFRRSVQGNGSGHGEVEEVMCRAFADMGESVGEDFRKHVKPSIWQKKNK